MLPPPRAVLFDLDQTLVDTDAATRAGVFAAGDLAASLYRVTREEWAAANMRAFAAEWVAVEADWIAGRADPAALSRSVGLRTLELTGGPAELEARLSAAFGSGSRSAATPFPDVIPLLDALEQSGIPAGIVTNSVPEIQRALLSAVGLDARIDLVVISGEHGVAKPDPAIFDVALRSLDLPAASVWHVGDNPLTDVAGAVAAGLPAVWLNREGRARGPEDPAPDLEVRSLRDLIPVLADTRPTPHGC